MHVATGTNSLHDLLADIAAFSEIKGMILFCLLRQVTFSNVGTILGKADHHTELFQRLGAYWNSASLQKLFPDVGNVRGRSPDLIRKEFGACHARKRKRHAIPCK